VLMTPAVNHEARRQHVASIAAELACDRGLESLTVRNVAAAAGYSTAIVSHYFTDKRDLLLATYRWAADRSTARFEAAEQDGEGLRACVSALLPLDEPRLRDWRVWFAFWGAAASDPELARDQRDRVRSARRRLERILRAGMAAGQLSAGANPTQEARRLLVVVFGVSVQTVFDPAEWTANKQLRFLDRELGDLVAAVNSNGLTRAPRPLITIVT